MKKLLNIKATGTLSEKTYDILKNAIIDLELEPGELITVEEISEQLGVSRTPIRTALNRLISEDLVEMIPGKGTFVTRLTEKNINDLISVRKLLEGFSIELAAVNRTEDDLERLDFLLQKQALAHKGQYRTQQGFLTYDSEFHCLIAQISQNTVVEKQLLQITDNCRRYLNAATMDDSIPMALLEHNELYEQIKNQNPEKARDCMYRHIDNVKLRLVEVLKKNDMRF